MKKLAVFVLTAVLAFNTFGSILPQGTSEIGLSGAVDFEGPGGTSIDLAVFYGYFVRDLLEAGLGIELYNDDDVTAWAIGPKVEYNFDLGTELAPYVGGKLLYAAVDANNEDKNAAILGLEAGGKYFITEYLAASLAFVVEVASEDIYAGDNEMTDHDERIELGLRTFF